MDGAPTGSHGCDRGHTVFGIPTPDRKAEVSVNTRELRGVFGLFATGVTVVSCRNIDDGRPHGATVTAFTPISLEPALCQVTLTRTSKACQFLDGQPFAVNVLAENQADVAWHFAGRPASPAPVLVDGPTAPVLERAAATFSCRPWASYDGGDHLIFLGEIVGVAVEDVDPLLFHHSSFKSIGPRLDASAWRGCQDDPTAGWFTTGATLRPSHRLPA
jgi:flavin reductase (DIM6/NTAB) family NADH-FMN oxidoreductase RutF